MADRSASRANSLSGAAAGDSTPVGRLPRRLGVLSTAGVLVGVIIGSGIFRVPSLVAAEVGSVGGAALVWVVGGLVTLCGALTLADLAATFPRAGGAYAFLREAYGPLVAFLYGWIKLVVTGPAAVAAVALIFTAYAGSFFSLSDTQQRLLAVLLLAVLTLLNVRSVRWTAAVQNLSTAAKLLALAALSLALLALSRGSEGALAQPVGWSVASWGGFGVALIAVLWTYVGWVDVTYLAGEVENPGRTYPRAMLVGLAAVVGAYVLANLAFYSVLPLPEIASSRVVASTAAERVLGPAGGALVAALVMLSTFGSLTGTLLASPRVFYAMAEDGLFFRAVAAVHPRYQTPYGAVLLFLVIGSVAVMTRTFEQLAQIFVLGIWPFYALTVGAVFVLRRRAASRLPALRGWGYPYAPALFLLVSAAMLVNGVLQRPWQSALSLGILLLGVPVYYGWRAVQARLLAGEPAR